MKVKKIFKTKACKQIWTYRIGINTLCVWAILHAINSNLVRCKGVRPRGDLVRCARAQERVSGFAENWAERIGKWYARFLIDFSALWGHLVPMNTRLYCHLLPINRKIYLMSDENFTPDIFVNQSISFDEVEKVIDSLKTKEAVGIDLIPNEVLKSHDVKMILYIYFNKLFEFNKIPTLWLKSLIKPIPKISRKDPLVPLNYRAISLLSCIYKVYSGLWIIG